MMHEAQHDLKKMEILFCPTQGNFPYAFNACIFAKMSMNRRALKIENATDILILL